MSKSRNRNSLLLAPNRSSYVNSTKDELLNMKFQMTKPDLPLYPLNDDSTTYPDYDPWRDQNNLSEDKKQKEYARLNNPGFLNKGYFETPIVSNEYYSARNLIQATIFSLTENCNNVLKELSLHLANGYKARNENINKIRFQLNGFKLPPRVTLTASKRESWLKDLANSTIPISKISEKIPHGIRNKVLIDLICSKNVPINRALWFTKSVLYGELVGLRRKHQSRPETLDKFEIHWLQEWTQQVSDYIYKYSKEMNMISTQDRKQQYMFKLDYLLKYVQALYIECLLDKSYFLSLILRFLREQATENKTETTYSTSQITHSTSPHNGGGETDLSGTSNSTSGQSLISFTLIKIFWKDILKLDYLSKELSEALLLNHYYILKAKLPLTLKNDTLKLISDQIVYLFKYNANVFIIPNSWLIVNRTLFRILHQNSEDQESIETQLDLIKYRNESLMLNLRTGAPISSPLIQTLNQLDKLLLNNELANSLKPQSNSWKANLQLVVYWCISTYRDSSSERILIICNFIKKKVLQLLNSKSDHLKFENEILEIIYNIADSNDPRIKKYNLYVLINELYQLKVVTISTYLRKLIASGIFYQSPGAGSTFDYDPQVQMHLDILQNLPVLNNKQCDSILKRWIPDGFDFNEKFEKGKQAIQTELIDGVITNDSPEIEISYVNDLNVGLKFLLINWTTNELKSAISTSPKLVHINPQKITHLYQFYLLCDNLTVFFKVLVKFLLKNEGGMIILYLDSLYLISRLVMKHFKLIKFIAGYTYDSVSTGYELFKLIVANYKDLQSREFDCYNFQQVWEFIDTAIEKVDLPKNYGTPKETPKETPRSETPRLTSDTPRFSDRLASDTPRFTQETPIKVERFTPFKEAPMKDPNTHVEEELLRTDLEHLLNLGCKYLEQSDITDIIEGLHLTIEDLKSSIPTQLEYLISEISDEQQFQILKLLIHTRNLDPILFTNEVGKFLEQTKNPVKVILFELFKLEDLADESLRSVLFIESRSLIFNIIREEYKKTNVYSKFILSGVNEFVEIEEVLEYLRGIAVVNPQVVMEEVANKAPVDSNIALFNKLLESNISHISDFEGVYINEFNLPMYQILLRLVLQQDLQDSTQAMQVLDGMVRSFLGNLAIEFESSLNSYFGELFNFVGSEYRLMILNILEKLFLEETKTLEDTDVLMNDTDDKLDQLELDQDGHVKPVQSIKSINLFQGNTNLLPVVNDFFKKFLALSMTSVESSSEFFTSLSKFLVGLVAASNTTTTNINFAISIFLRILIIHKPSLTTMMLATDPEFSFIKNLINLLNSSCLAKENEKLRILLYDLLLLLKAAITEEALISEPDMEATSPGYIPKPSPEKQETPLELTETASISSSHILTIFNIPESNQESPLRGKVDNNLIASSMMLDEEELLQGGDYQSVNESHLELVRYSDGSLTNAFGILVHKSREFKMRSFEILEDVSGGLNDGCINLHMFDAYTTKENPM